MTSPLEAGLPKHFGEPRREVVYGNVCITLLTPPIADQDVIDVTSLLQQNTTKFKDTQGGHVPAHIVEDIIHRTYTSEDSVRRTFAQTAHRFVARDKTTGGLLGTLLIAREPDVILMVNGEELNRPRDCYPDIQPPNHHSTAQFTTNPEARGQGVAKKLLTAALTDFRDLFSGEGLFMRSDPPLHDVYQKLGFTHDPQWDDFLPEDALLPGGYEDTAAFNKAHVCACTRPSDHAALLETRRYKYAGLILKFDTPQK